MIQELEYHADRTLDSTLQQLLLQGLWICTLIQFQISAKHPQGVTIEIFKMAMNTLRPFEGVAAQ